MEEAQHDVRGPAAPRPRAGRRCAGRQRTRAPGGARQRVGCCPAVGVTTARRCRAGPARAHLPRRLVSAVRRIPAAGRIPAPTSCLPAAARSGWHVGLGLCAAGWRLWQPSPAGRGLRPARFGVCASGFGVCAAPGRRAGRAAARGVGTSGFVAAGSHSAARYLPARRPAAGVRPATGLRPGPGRGSRLPARIPAGPWLPAARSAGPGLISRVPHRAGRSAQA